MPAWKKRLQAKYDELLALPEHLIGEIVDGELRVSPRPASLHAFAGARLLTRLEMGQSGGGSGPDRWWTLYEPELHLGRDVLVPDLAGWQRARMPTYPDVAFFGVSPDWICEVLSPSTARIDFVQKLPKYAAGGVDYAWIVDPVHKLLQVLHRTGESWSIVSVFAGSDVVRAEPFFDIEFSLDALWPGTAREAEATFPAEPKRPRSKAAKQRPRRASRARR